jgi:hypothetical protein
METYRDVWSTARGSVAVPSFGFQYTVGLEHVPVNVARMLDIFREGLRNLREIWVEVLGAGDFGEVESLGRLANADFRFPLPLWTRVVYDYAAAYHKRKLPATMLLKSLTPLYLGKTASFVMEAQDLDQAGAEAEIEKLCVEFEKGKDHLMNAWGT